MEIQIVGMIRRVESTCACGEEHAIGKVCDKCITQVMQVVTIKDVQSLHEGQTAANGSHFHVTEVIR